MNKLVKLNFNPSYNGLIPEVNIKFINEGEVTIPSKYGGYVISSGCAAVKTEAIKQMIIHTYKTGVVYSAATIDECNKMYKYLSEVGPNYGLAKDNIIVLHSETIDEGVDLNMMRRNDEEIRKKRKRKKKSLPVNNYLKWILKSWKMFAMIRI